MHGSSESPVSFTLGELVDRLQLELHGDPSIEVRGIGSLDGATADQVSFVADARYAPMAARCRAAALIVPKGMADLAIPRLVSDQPTLAFARLAQLFVEPPYLADGIHPSAWVSPEATLGEGVRVGPLAQIGPDCHIGDRSRIYGGAYLGRSVTLGEACCIHPRAVILDECRLGNRVAVHSGTVIGSDGFGYAQDPRGHHVKIPQMGIVEIEDDVEIGANCAVDRATFGRTTIKTGAKVDNLVQIAHNVTVGEHSILVSQVGISGSTKIGKHVVLAGQVGVVGHIEIGDRVRVGAKSGVHHSVKAGEDISGYPAVPHKEYLKNSAYIRRIGSLRDELRELKRRVQSLEGMLSEE